jgi:PAS domain S-box-containing protein
LTTSSALGSAHHDHDHHHHDEAQHAVRFYVSSDELCHSVGAFLANALTHARPVVVIARPAHRDGFQQNLRERGVDIDGSIAAGDAVFLDAHDTLASFMVGGVPQRDLFRRAIVPVLARFGKRDVAAYGEMVDILWQAGQCAAALALEEMWNELQKDPAIAVSFDLLCAYAQPADGPSTPVCEAHNVVELLPTEKLTAVAELAHRKRVERELRRALHDLQQTERELSDFVNNAAFALHSVAGDGTILWANRAELRLLGFEAKEYVGQNIRGFHVDADVIEDILARLSRNEELVDVPSRVRAKDGSVRHVLITSNARVLDGKIEATRCSMRDVTESVVASQRIHELNDENNRARQRAELVSRVVGAANRAARADDVFDACMDAMIDFGVERCSILAFDAAHVMRFRAWRGLSESYRKAIEGHNPWQRAVSGFEPIVIDDVASDTTLGVYGDVFRREKIATVTFIPLVARGQLIGKFTLGWTKPHEVSSHDLATATLIGSHVATALVRFKVLDELHETVRFNEMFTGILAHDLRNPLNAIILGAHAIEAKATDATHAQRILRSGERMSRMIDQLLDFTRVRLGGGIPVRRGHADVLSVLRRILEEHAASASRIELAHRGDTRGDWDEDRLAQVFSNLVGNALEHGERTDPITISIVGEHDAVRAEIHNRGVIPAELLPKLFEPLSGASKNRPGSRGLGLGLFITRQIVEAHRGHIEVTSAPEQGTRFHIWLPRDASS